MPTDIFWHRLQFAFTITYHYLFPQLTMGLALLIVIMKSLALARGDERWNDAARFWIRIFGINFAVGVVTGVPMEFQFGTNWANFSRLTGRVIGHTLAMEGLFAFFLESTFLAVLVWGERRVGRAWHFAAAVALFAGSWLSGYFIIATNSFMQHPVGHEVLSDGTFRLVDFGAFLFNPWALAAYAHNMVASVVTASFVVAACGAYYTLTRPPSRSGPPRFSCSASRRVSPPACSSRFRPATPRPSWWRDISRSPSPRMEGRFESGGMAGITLIGQPNVRERRLDNPIHVPGVLSFLAFGTFHSNVPGLLEFPEDQWPDNIELLYYAFHVDGRPGHADDRAHGGRSRSGLDRTALRSRGVLWVLMLAFPFPYIATTAGWMTTELGPPAVAGRTDCCARRRARARPCTPGRRSSRSSGSAAVYLVLGALFLFLVGREIAHGPELDADPWLSSGTASSPSC